MTLSAILKKYYDIIASKIAEKLPNIVSEANPVFFIVVIFAVSTLFLAWNTLNVHPLKLECITNSDIKMTRFARLKKYYDKIVEKLPFIVSEAFLVLTQAFLVLSLAFICAVGILALPRFFFLVYSLKLDQIIFFISVLSATIVSIISFRFPVWFPSKSRFVEITCEIILFSLSEIAVFVPITMNVFWIWESGQSISLSIMPVSSTNGLMGYVFVLHPLTNAVIHLAFIYHLMRRPKYALAAFIAAVKAGYCILGLILLYSSMLEGIHLLKENDGAFAILLLLPLSLQVTTFMMILMQVQSFDAIVKRLEDGKHIKWIDLYPHFRLIVVVIGMVPILISIVIILTNYEATSFVNKINEFNDTVVDRIAFMRELENYEQSSQFAKLSVYWSINMSMLLSLIRGFYLMFRIELQSKTSSLGTEFASYNTCYYQN